MQKSKTAKKDQEPDTIRLMRILCLAKKNKWFEDETEKIKVKPEV